MDTDTAYPPCLTLFRPASGKEIPLIIDSPHSGRDYPADFNHACPRATLERVADNDVDILFDAAPAYGAPMLCANFPRTYIDVNRAETDIDMNLLAERWPGPIAPSSRSHAGIGLLHRLVRPGVLIYDKPLPVEQIQHRLDHYYRPYHQALKKLLDDAHYRFGQVWHLNCHSMPAAASAVLNGRRPMQPDFVLGDRDGTSCDPDFTHAIRDALKGMGYRVAINNPYKGVEILRRYANPAAGRHSIQIEVSKALYWDAGRSERTANFNALKGDIDKLLSFCSVYASSNLVNLAAD